MTIRGRSLVANIAGLLSEEADARELEGDSASLLLGRSGNGADGLGIEPRSTAISSRGRCCASQRGVFRSRCVAM